MFGRRKRDRVLVLCAGERRLLTAAMLVFRNKLLSSGKPDGSAIRSAAIRALGLEEI